jgi:TonB family protein
MELSFGGPPRRGPLDLSSGRFSHALSAMQPATSAQSDDVGAGWLNALSAWLHQHGYYPEAAAANGDEGIVRVRFVVLRDGTVKSVELMTPSRSPFLNMAPPAWLRGARLPALPPGTRDGQATVVLTVRFILIR